MTAQNYVPIVLIKLVMFQKRLVIPFAFGILLSSCALFHRSAKKTYSENSTKPVLVKIDTSKRSDAKLKPYAEVITKQAVTDEGLFKVHRIDERFYFEISDSLLGRDLLIINRIAKAASYARSSGTLFGYAGDMIGENVVELSRGPNYKLFLKRVLNTEVSKDTSANGLYRSVLNSNVKPIVASFDIKALSMDGKGIVVDLTDFINSDNSILSFVGSFYKETFGVGAMQADKSYIHGIRSFPENVEIRTVKTYMKAGGAAVPGAPETKTYELNSSIVLLPLVPMQIRQYDERVGYFATWVKDFDINPQGVDYSKMVNRWRLEPAEKDIPKYLKGELVEPKKPIIFYIDPTTPKKWIPYLIQGVNDWQKAFEKAGFKKAIYAREAPDKEEDSTWSLEDARFSAIVYKPSDIENANGPHVHDPRSGEILESHINWYHNVMQLLHDWYFVQAGAVDPRARKIEYDDSLMGQLIRFVSSHEVGHTLGLTHNFGASSTIPVERLRDKAWVEENGFCPSIMDYARFNYVAQPEDSIAERGIFPRIGVYDEWAIEWGYTWLPNQKSEKEQRAYFSALVTKRLAKDKRLWFGAENNPEDARSQSEDLGDDGVKASFYGIKNLKRIYGNLIDWLRAPGENYDNLKRMQVEVLQQYQRYLFHVTKIIGSVYYTPKTMDQNGTVFQFPSKKKQKDALLFLYDNLFIAPDWLLNKKIFSLTGTGSDNNVLGLQNQVLKKLLSQYTFGKLRYAQFYEPEDAYRIDEFLSDLRGYIWKEIDSKAPISEYRRNLQKDYVIQLISLLEAPDAKNSYPEIINDITYFHLNRRTDVSSSIKGHIKDLIVKINASLPYYKSQAERLHLIDIKDRLSEALEPKRK